MTTTCPPIQYRARWLLGPRGYLIENGVAEFSNSSGWTFRKFSAATDSQALDFGNCLVSLPLVNAHTHLEFSHLTQPLGTAGMEFSQWIRHVLQWRFQQDSQHPSEALLPHQRGWWEVHRAGTGLVADIVSAPWLLNYWSSTSLDTDIVPPNSTPVIALLEQLGAKPEQASERLSALRERCQQLIPAAQPTAAASDSRLHNAISSAPIGDRHHFHPALRVGLSPHAPYSTSRALFQGMLSAAQKQSWPVAMHVAESLAERELLEQGRGPFQELLEQLKLWTGRDSLPQISEVIHQLAQRTNCGLIVHGNYLTTAEMDLIAKHRERLSVVYCPRTHLYFQHQPYPLLALRSRGIAVAVGTDSLASNPDLDLFGELQTIARSYRELSPAEIWEMGIDSGAKALGLWREDTATGWNPRGLLCWELGDADLNDPLNALLYRPQSPQRRWLEVSSEHRNTS